MGTMATAIQTQLLSASEFAELPEPIHGGKMELVRGKVVVMPPVGPDHGEGASDITSHLHGFVRARGLGRVRVETGYWLSAGPDDVRAPDVSFVSEARRALETVVNGVVNQAPDLAIEIVSPNDRESEIADKVDAYLAAGVLRVWVVRPGTENRDGAPSERRQPHLPRWRFAHERRRELLGGRLRAAAW